MRIVHLPFYDDNPYQTLLMEAQRELGHEVWEGGGGGNFLGVALKKWKADLIHFHWLHPYLLRESSAASVARSIRFLAEVALLRTRGARVVWTIHNLVNHDGKHAEIDRRFSAAFAKLCSDCFVHSHAAAEAATRRFGISPDKLKVIPHGNYIGVYPNEASPASSRQLLGIPESARVFLFLGRIEPYKGVFDLMEAFLQLPSDSHLLVAGKVADPSLLPELEKRAELSDRIHVHPRRIPEEELQHFYHAADVVVFPFQKILTSGSLVLAMSFGKAVVAPKVASIEEILPEDGVRWFEPGKDGTLAEAMKAWPQEALGSAGEKNYQRARSWDWKSIAEAVSVSSSVQ